MNGILIREMPLYGFNMNDKAGKKSNPRMVKSLRTQVSGGDTCCNYEWFRFSICAIFDLNPSLSPIFLSLLYSVLLSCLYPVLYCFFFTWLIFPILDLLYYSLSFLILTSVFVLYDRVWTQQWRTFSMKCMPMWCKKNSWKPGTNLQKLLRWEHNNQL